MNELRTTLLTILMLSVAAPAWALDPEEADLVDSITTDVPSFNPADPDLNDDAIYVGHDNCESMLANTSRVQVTFGTAFNPQQNDDLIEQVDVFAVERDSRARIDCLTGDICLPVDEDEDINYTTSGVAVDITFEFLLEAGEVEDCEGYDKEFFIRLTVEDSLDGSDATENADVKIVIDNIEPSAPSGTTASATESRIAVNFTGSADEDVRRYWVYYSTSSFEGGQSPDAVSSLERKLLGDDTDGDVSVALDPTKPLYVAVVAEDYAGNLSSLSGVVEADVQETNDFWESYKKAGGEEEGGCATTNGTASPWLVLLGIGLFGLRRRRRFAAAATAALLTLAPLGASAETPTWGAMDLKFAGYYPAIDAEFGDTGPFSDTFGTKSLLLGELEVAGWLWQGFGKLGVAGHVGYSRVKGGAVPTEETASDEEADAIEDTTAFAVFPLRVSAVYRFDWLAQNTRIPLSFSVKVGPDFYRWRITNSNKQTAEFDGASGAGWTSGWHAAAGLQLLLDVLDTSTAAAFDLHWGVNNSYLFVEYMATKIDDFGGGGFDLSDNLWLFGLSFEF